MNSAFQAFGWHSNFAFPLWFLNELCISSLLQALEIRIFAAIEYCSSSALPTLKIRILAVRNGERIRRRKGPLACSLASAS